MGGGGGIGPNQLMFPGRSYLKIANGSFIYSHPSPTTHRWALNVFPLLYISVDLVGELELSCETRAFQAIS
jgi:hypothetical protein